MANKAFRAFFLAGGQRRKHRRLGYNVLDNCGGLSDEIYSSVSNGSFNYLSLISPFRDTVFCESIYRLVWFKELGFTVSFLPGCWHKQ
jgi:hypothetical protein